MPDIMTRTMPFLPSRLKQPGIFATRHPATGKIHHFESRAELNAFQKANRSKWSKWGKPTPRLN